MLTVLMEAGDDAEALARTLASLVGGAIEGVVREVMVNAAGAGDDALRVADHAGCTLLESDLAAGLHRAKGDWLLLLEPGARLSEGWTDAVRAHADGAGAPARFSPSRAGSPPFLSRLFRTRRPLEHGLLIRKRSALARSGEAQNPAALALGLRTMRLAAEIIPARR